MATFVALCAISALIITMLMVDMSSNATHYTCTTDGAADEVKYPIQSYSEMPKRNRSAIPETNLPILNLGTPFVGREKEVAEISSYLRSETVYVIGIHGPPAFGKSTLAIHIGWIMMNLTVSVRYVDVSERDLFKLSNQNKQDSESESTSKAVQTHTGQLQSQLEQSEFWSKENNNKCKGHDNLCANLLHWAGNLTLKHVLILDNCDNMLLPNAKGEFKQLINTLFQRSSYRHLSVVLTSQAKVKFMKQDTRTFFISDLSRKASLTLLRALIPEQYNITSEDGGEIATLVGHCPLALRIVAEVIKDLSGSVAVIIDRLKRNVLKAISSVDLSAEDTFDYVMEIAYNYLPTET